MGDRDSNRDGGQAGESFASAAAEQFARVFEEHRAALVRHCTGILRDADGAEDVVQETYLRAYARLEQFDPTRPTFPWLLTIAHRLALNTRRDTRARPAGGNGAWLQHAVREPSMTGKSLDPLFESVRARQELQIVLQAFRQLPSRQQRVLFQSLAGKSHAQIAAAENLSKEAVKLLAFRARQTLRTTTRDPLAVIIVAPLAALRRQVRHLVDRARLRFGPSAESLLGITGGSFAQAAAAIAISLSALAPQSPPALGPLVTSGGESALSSGIYLGGTPPVADSRGASIRGTAATPRNRPLVDQLLPPTKDATPENTQFSSVAASPNYERDHTLVAAGTVACPQGVCHVIFVSEDGGATWARAESRNFDGYNILLPPAFPADPRIFAMGLAGLQVSNDFGASFHQALPVHGEAALSPLFNGTDPRILIGAGVVTEYWPDSGVAKPATLVVPAGAWTVAFSPSYAHDHIVFVGGWRYNTRGVMSPTLSRCAKSICNTVTFTVGGSTPWIRPSPRFADDSTVYAFSGRLLFRSTDGGRGFDTLSPKVAADGGIRDLHVAQDGTLVAAVSSLNGVNGIFRSADGGMTWSGGAVKDQGFLWGASRILITPDGREIAAGSARGLACSINRGRTWAPRCPSY